DEVWCQGFSEPGAGSDLAALRTRGELRGDHLLVNGQKVWTSYARYADWCIVIVRTDPSAAKHRGLTFALVDMKTPGITVRPLVEMTGVAWFNEVFFENVVIPRDMVVGEINRGWDIASTTLSHERGTAVPYPRLKHHVDGIVALARRLANDLRLVVDPVLRQRVAQLSIDAEIVRLTAYRNITHIIRSGRPGPEGSMLKLLLS